ncbi:hypothetical protein Gasu2_59400 [Galdieria sulphuraria]|uniref:Uncharacterized protein n=1 Tax=Galdieria sulphuraria TaxID=130081 RepID=M2WQR9_GALSU|nr:uncharacterized protein Gasu_62130 [Galdieria sulphuraria]EME26140.1 hypothetical protein Gasu_62130 [Galdieria sulphuraria]GJD11815.1 hypothetical protein Gasu2_59400 [Galdieria sulphuraria]|eukprot:XP_005702660.1 hypothetical protein Gasu_62130 [Galdieria sulphuraria]
MLGYFVIFTTYKVLDKTRRNFYLSYTPFKAKVGLVQIAKQFEFLTLLTYLLDNDCMLFVVDKLELRNSKLH